MTIQITQPEIKALIDQCLRTGRFRDAEDVILQGLRSLGTEVPGVAEERSKAIGRLKAFGKEHRLSLGGMTIRDLRDEARP